MSRIIRRIFAIIPAIILQAIWIYILLTWLAPWNVAIEFVLSILSVIFVLYLITKQEESTYKILWLLIILTFPLPGALLYLLFGNKRTTRPLKKKLKRANTPATETADTSAFYEEMSLKDSRLSQTFYWVETVTGFPLLPNEDAEYYPLGDDMFPVMLEEMRKARRYIFVEYFIIDNGVMWDSMTEILAEKAAQGVDVRVLYDDVGSLTTYAKKDAEKLRKKGIRCAAFNPLVFVKGTLNCRDHRKMLIIDGRIAFSGGINLADEYINKTVKYGHWKDIGFRLTGRPVQNYVKMFTLFWNAFANPPIPAEYLREAAQDALIGSVQDDLIGSEQNTDGLVLSYYDSPLENTAISNELYIDLLSQAQSTAWFYTPYLMPGNALLDAFVRAAQRGVDVRIIMPGIPDKKLVYRMSRSFYPVLLGAGVKIYEYTPGFIHAKACVIDGIVGTVGTVNLDYRSLFLHFENNSLFYRASLLDDLCRDFLATQEKCRERTLDNVKITFGKWFVDGILRIFSPLC